MIILGVFYLRDSVPELVNIERAIAAYRTKHVGPPNVCYFNKDRFPLEIEQESMLGIKIKTSPLVHPSMIWVGLED